MWNYSGEDTTALWVWCRNGGRVENGERGREKRWRREANSGSNLAKHGKEKSFESFDRCRLPFYRLAVASIV